MFKQTVQQIFPNSYVDSNALGYPWTPAGWPVQLPTKEQCRFDQPNFYVVLNLQDMLTQTANGISELTQIHNHFATWADMSRVIVVVWPQRLPEVWPKDSFQIVEFSTHQYATWQQYKANEALLRETFAEKHKQFEYNFVCMNRHDKPHRRIAYSRLRAYGMSANCSLQSKGYELAYPNKLYEDYEHEYNNCDNLLSLDANFNTALFNIITESQYAEQYGIVTEKTFNAIVAGQPFAVIGHQLCLEDIKCLGFVTYDTVFDEEYDLLDNQSRIDTLIHCHPKLIQKHMSLDDMWQVYDYCREKIEYNRDYFFNNFGPDQFDSFQKQLLTLWK